MFLATARAWGASGARARLPQGLAGLGAGDLPHHHLCHAQLRSRAHQAARRLQRLKPRGRSCWDIWGGRRGRERGGGGVVPGGAGRVRERALLGRARAGQRHPGDGPAEEGAAPSVRGGGRVGGVCSFKCESQGCYTRRFLNAHVSSATCGPTFSCGGEPYLVARFIEHGLKSRFGQSAMFDVSPYPKLWQGVFIQTVCLPLFGSISVNAPLV